MSDIELVFREPFAIGLQGRPEVSYAQEAVEMTLPVFAAGFRDATVQIHVYMSVAEAQELSSQLLAGLEAAQRQPKGN